MAVDVDAIEDARPDVRVTPGRWDAAPYPGWLFTELLDAALACHPDGAPGPRFCDLGAGVGGQVLRATARGCDAWGVEIEPAWAAVARDAGATVLCMLAEDAPLGGTGIVYLNQLYQAAAEQAALEDRVRRRMDPGAVMVAANYATRPPGSWEAVFLDVTRRRGVWVKPS